MRPRPAVTATLRWLVWTELRSLVREPLALLLLFLTPALVTPLIAAGVGGASARDAARVDAAHLAVAMSPEVEAALELDWAGLGLERVDPGSTRAVVHLEAVGDAIEARYRGDRWRSTAALERLGPGLQAWQERSQATRWSQLGVVAEPRGAWTVEAVDHAGAETRADAAAARVLAPMLVFLVLTGGLYVCLDRFAGEKERGTLETLLASRAPRRAVLWAKTGVVGGVAYLLAATTTSSLVLGHALGWLDGPALGGLASPPSPAALGWVLWMLLPLTATLVGGLVAVAAWVPGFREGQALGIPLLLLGTAPSLVAGLPGVELGGLLAVVPVAGVSLALRDAVSGTLPLGMGVLVWGAAAVHAGLAMAAARHVFERDTVLVGRGAFRTDPDDHRAIAWGTFAVALLATWFLGQLAQARSGVGGLVFTLGVLVAGPAVVGAVVSGRGVGRVLGLRRPSARDLALSVVLGICAPAVGDLVARAQVALIPAAAARTEAMGDALDLGLGLPGTLLVLAVLPAVCEELLFRGTLLRLLRTRASATAAVATSALWFGLFHLDLVRLAPTAVLGALFAVASLRTGSVGPAMVAHGLNNGAWIGLVALGWVDATADLPLWIDLVGVVVAIGTLSAMGPPSSRRHP